MSIDLSLRRVAHLLSHLPPYTRPTVHIAGTNGKGSVSALTSSILLESSFSVGRFNSPHLVSIYDSIVINGKPVDAESYWQARHAVEHADTLHGVGATSFELLTSTALLVFERAAVEVVVLEVGMGGRLDATNAIADDVVLASALTAVDLDHQNFLGDTVHQIAQEKAGIARRGVPFVLGPQKFPEVIQSVKQAVAVAGADLILATAATKSLGDPSLDDEGTSSDNLPLYGEHQLDNLGVAAGIVDALRIHPSSFRKGFGRDRISSSTVAAGIRNTTWPGRLSFHDIPASMFHAAPGTQPPLLLADGAHNASSSTTLASYLSHLLTQPTMQTIHITFILALSHSPPKSPLQTLSPLFAFSRPPGVEVSVDVAVLKFTTPVDGMPWLRPVPPSDLQEVVKELLPAAEIWSKPDEEDPRDAHLYQALRWACGKPGGGRDSTRRLIVVAGSLYLVADLYRLLQSL
ncbi:Mur ligase [Auriscalpium vulgare]|uniref:Mur ligase n=1 Tax=Auriscalpium vulgare TaxID=40419 RepID=A0ACB8S4M4_9AGAM|nr:Mur ligase [Auriscalpium vulgare]